MTTQDQPSRAIGQPVPPAQPELRLFEVPQGDHRIGIFLALLKLGGWQTRKQIAEKLGCDDRTIRSIAEAAGDQIIRGQRGFAYFESATIEEILHSANQSISQGKIMIRYGLSLKRRVHKRVA